MVGSLVIVEAESLEEVRKLIESDVYYTSNVVRVSVSSSRRFVTDLSSHQWDKEKLVISPIVLGLPLASTT